MLQPFLRRFRRIFRGGSRMKRILVVDDDAQGLDSTRRILEFAGYEVLTAGDGEEALGQVQIGRAHV